MASIIDYVRENIDPKVYYTKMVPEAKFTSETSEPRVRCLFHDERTPSLHLNPKTGAWYCHGCEAGGKSIVSFHSRTHDDCGTIEAAKKLFAEFIHPVIPETDVLKWAKQLVNTPTALRYLLNDRHLSAEIIERFNIGWNGHRFVIPIRNEFGLCVNAKLYDPLAKGHGVPKMLNYKLKEEPRQFGVPTMLFPLKAMELAKETGLVVICEGEWDALCLLSMGIAAVTSSHGSKSWPNQYNELFRGLEVVIAYDNDKDGVKFDKIPMRALRNIARIIRRVTIPKQFGKDVTDWVRKKRLMRQRTAWLKVLTNAPVLLENSAERVAEAETQVVGLSQASEARWFNKRVCVDALVTGKDIAPYMLPKKIRVSCNKSCETCPLAESGKEFREREVKMTDPQVLGLMDVPKSTLTNTLLTIAGMHCKPACQAKVEVLETFNVENLILIPTLDSSGGQYVMRPSYYVGHGLLPNRAYRFEGITTPHPRDQHTTHLFDKAKPVQDEIENFELTEELKQRLKVFQPRTLARRPGKPDPLKSHLHSIAEWQSRNITRIRQRDDLHIAVDLVYHSVPGFAFNREVVSRGMLDVLVIGDTRCGKGFVTEGLKRYYGLGEIASGENCSFAGLVGGLQQPNGKRFIVTWGIIPLNNGRLVIIDEASALKEEDFGKLSRVRSEGVAEISKIVRESTQANARLVWLSNPRSGRPIMSYPSGVVAIKELIGNNEDISRFDFALTVATNEVPSNQINTEEEPDTSDSTRFPRDLCRALVLWAWSRKPEQIDFTPEATHAVIRHAVDFGNKYSPAVPLVQAENIRIKIAKIAAAVAARTFSTDDSCQMIVVRPEHVNYACSFLRDLYAKPSMGYERYSESSLAAQKINATDVDKVFDSFNRDQTTIMAGLMNLHKVTAESLADFTGDRDVALTLIGDLVRAHCIQRVEAGNYYLKSANFSQWLRRKVKEASK